MTTTDESIYYPAVATFKTAHRLDLGKPVRVEFQGQVLFEGRVIQTSGYPGSVEIRAVDHTGWNDRAAPRSRPTDPLRIAPSYRRG